MSHSLALAEHALAAEAFAVGRMFERVGIAFDPITFVALRVLEGSLGSAADPIASLEELERLGLLERSVERAEQLLDDVA